MLTSEQIEEEISRLVETNHPDVFIVDISLNTGRKNVLSVLIDTDEGITIAKCAKISREIGHFIEEEDPLKNAFTLEVSSPGVGYPLKNIRQYRKNIGRILKLTLKTEEEGKTERIKGKLAGVEEEGIRFLPQKGKEKSKKNPGGKFLTGEETQIGYDRILEAKVEISFN